MTKHHGNSPLKAIRAKCKDCATTFKNVKWCPATGCDLWEFRFGCRPTRAKRLYPDLMDRDKIPHSSVLLEELA